MGIIKNLLSVNASAASLAAAMCFALPMPAVAQQARYTFDISAQNLDAALKAFGRTTRLQLVYDGQAAHRARTAGLKGQFAAAEGLAKLLDGSGFVMRAGQSGVFIVETRSPSTAQDDRPGTATADILVVGGRSQNVDIKRTRDDAQPYVVFDSQTIEKSQATDLNDFLRTRLPMNSVKGSSSQYADTGSANPYNVDGNSTPVNLRGLGANQTLILIDGRRAPRMLDWAGSDAVQADINAIPLSSIERIEILPSTAGAIYGGGAVGGVINIIRKRNYKGVDLKLGFDGPFGPDGKTFRADVSGGLSLEGGRTQLSFSASYVKSWPLYTGSNDLWRRTRDAVFARKDFFSNYWPMAQATPTIFSNSGANLILKDGKQLASNGTFVPPGYAGWKVDGIDALIANSDRNRFDPASFQDGPTGKRGIRILGTRTRSANVNIRRTFSPAIDAFADFTYSDNQSKSDYPITQSVRIPAGAESNPFQQDIIVYYPFSDTVTAGSETRTIAGSGGLIAKLGGGWTATTEYDWSQSRTVARAVDYYSVLNDAYFAGLANGTLDLLRDPAKYPIDLSPYLSPGPTNIYGPYVTVSQDMSARVSGSPLRLPGGPLSLTALLERRLERADFSSSISHGGALDGDTSPYPVYARFYPKRTQAVNSAYLEARAPLVSDRNAMPFIRELELTGSVRYDDYRTRTAKFYYDGQQPPPYATSKAHAFSYMAAMRWAPVTGIMFRGTYSTGFLPPSISQVSPSYVKTYDQNGYLGAEDPMRNNEQLSSTGPLTVVSGGNPALKPETSKSLTAGVILTPAFLPGFRFSADYSRIRKRNAIAYIYDTTLMSNIASFPERVKRVITNDGTLGPINWIDVTPLNTAKARAESYDFQADWNLDTPKFGSFHFYAIATLMTKNFQQYLPSDIGYDTVGFRDGALRWRGNAGLDWSYGKLSLFWNAQYYNSYSVRYGNSIKELQETSDFFVQMQGAERIPSQIYNDISARYQFGTVSGAMSGVTITAGIQNVFNKKPPMDVTLQNYSAYGDPRLRRFTLRIGRHF